MTNHVKKLDVAHQISQMSIDFQWHPQVVSDSWAVDATRLGNPAKDFQITFWSRYPDKKNGYPLAQELHITPKSYECALSIFVSYL